MDATAADGLHAQFAQIGKFDHLVMALGSGKGLGPFATVRLADVKLGFEEKVYAHFATAQAALPFLDREGSITFVSAVSAHAAAPGTAGIGAANAAVAALVPILSVELKPLRVNGVSPGVIDTPWWDAFPEDQKQAMFKDYAAKTPIGRIGQPEDIAQAIAFLIGDRFMTGHMLICDGGLRWSI
jgi:NAD(P)-dependent dehydrogenase (short-subunit alcohol dehydrogenase family)